MISIALSKGRIAEETLEIFSKIFNKKFIFKDRKLTLEIDNFLFLLVRNQDVSTYVYHGAADLGVVGLDVLEENGLNLIRLLDLNIGKCKVVLGSMKNKPIDYMRPKIRIATKMKNITYRYFSAKAIALDIIKLYGSIELAPLINLADGIVDIVESGITMKQNNLEINEVIMESSAYLISNENSFFLKKKEILILQERIKKIILK